MGFGIPGSGFQVLDFGFRVSGFGFQILGMISNFDLRFRVSGVGCDLQFRTSGLGLLVHRRGLVFKAHRPLKHSTLGSRVVQREKKEVHRAA